MTTSEGVSRDKSNLCSVDSINESGGAEKTFALSEGGRARLQLGRISYTNSLRNRKRDSEVVTYPTRSNIKREELLVGKLSYMTFAGSYGGFDPPLLPPSHPVCGRNTWMEILHSMRLC